MFESWLLYASRCSTHQRLAMQNSSGAHVHCIVTRYQSESQRLSASVAGAHSWSLWWSQTLAYAHFPLSLYPNTRISSVLHVGISIFMFGLRIIIICEVEQGNMTLSNSACHIIHTNWGVGADEATCTSLKVEWILMDFGGQNKETTFKIPEI